MAVPVPRAVVVTRPTAYEALIAAHATHGQARFFLAERGQDLAVVEEAHRRHAEALRQVLSSIPENWRRAQVARSDLDRFLFEPEDIVLAVGQDGLVANVAKYLTGQPVVGINPLPELYDGILTRHGPEAAADLMHDTARGRSRLEVRSMVEAGLDDGQRLLALNEIFVGHRSHQSARYRLVSGSDEERHSSSGLIVATGTGATGWARSINLARGRALKLPSPVDRRLVFLVREAFPSRATGVDVTGGSVTGEQPLQVISEMNEGGVIFGDGMEGDHLSFGWGRTVSLRLAERCLVLVTD